MQLAPPAALNLLLTRFHKSFRSRATYVSRASLPRLFAKMTTINVPAEYPWVLLATTVAPFVTSMMLGGAVMSARKKFDVPYPNLYATPGVHKHADDFNRVQRGHQNMFETVYSVMPMAMITGLKYPWVAVGCALAYCLGSYAYLSGYANTAKDVKTARYSSPLAILKPLGMVGSLIGCVYVCYGMLA